MVDDENYPYFDMHGIRFRLERQSDHEWKVFQQVPHYMVGVLLGYREESDAFDEDECDTEAKAVNYWIYVQYQKSKFEEI